MTIEEIREMGAEQLCAKSTFIDIHDRDDEFEIAELLGAAIDQAKKLKIATRYKELLGAFKRQLRKGMVSNESQSFEYKNTQYDLGSWIIRDTGVCRWSDRGYVYACPHVILPVKRLKNLETKEEKITIASRRDGWQEITVPKEVVASASKIVTLAKFGIAVTSESARNLVQYVADIENINEIQVQNSTSKYGWHGTDFIPFDKAVFFDGDIQYVKLNESLNPKGSREVWMDLVRKLRQNTWRHYEPQLCISASLASVLIGPLSLLPFILNIYNKTGTGKTVTIMLACSVWADPGEKKYLTDALSTSVAFEIREDILTDLPLFIDDFSKVRDKFGDGFQDLIYMICSGSGKARSNIDLGLNPVKTWSNVCISNMERPLISETARGGQVNRVLDFEMDPGNIYQDGNMVAEIVRGNYGFIGREFVSVVKSLGFDHIRDMRKAQERRIREESKTEGRELEEKQLIALSILLTADQLATDHIFKDGIYLDLEKCVHQLKTTDEVEETGRAYDFIMDCVNQNRNKFDQSDNYHGEVWGSFKNGFVNINPLAFKKMSIDGNFSIKMFCRWADDKGLLKHTDGKYQNVVKEGGVPKRYYTIALPSEDQEAASDDFVQVGDDDLPFN